MIEKKLHTLYVHYAVKDSPKLRMELFRTKADLADFTQTDMKEAREKIKKYHKCTDEDIKYSEFSFF